MGGFERGLGTWRGLEAEMSFSIVKSSSKKQCCEFLLVRQVCCRCMI